MFDKPSGLDQSAGLRPDADLVDTPEAPVAPAVVKRPKRWSLTNWPVRWKVLAIAVVPLALAALFGGLRVYGSAVEARDLRLAADRATLVPVISDYMDALGDVLLAKATDGEVEQAVTSVNDARAAMLSTRDRNDVQSDVRSAVENLAVMGSQLQSGVLAGSVPLDRQVTGFGDLLLTAENAVAGSVRVNDEVLRNQAVGLARAVGAHGQMTLQRLLVEAGGGLPEPFLRNAMTTLAGTEPQTIIGMGQLLGGASEEATTLRSQMVQRLRLLADPSTSLVDNQQLLKSIQTTDEIATGLISKTTSNVVGTVNDEANDARNDAIRDAALVVVAFLVALAVVWWVARSLTRPLRRLRDGALTIAHEELAEGVERAKAGDEREPEPLPIYTTEEIGQVAHAVDQLHTQALLLAGDEARLRVMVNDMFETLSRRNKTLVDQQLSLIDRLERNEEDPDRLDSLFRLDHLATRMRRNGANLLVLAGAQVTREQGPPVPLASLINAAASEVEDYQRVETGMVPDCSLSSSAAGDSVHLLAELIDNALRYSPPFSPVRVTAVHTSDNGVLIDINDTGLGMTDSDLRIANMRLNAGGEVSPDNTRHMGLFVVGRLARQHGITVQLLPGASGSGTVAQVYLPPNVLHGFEPAAPFTWASDVEPEPVVESAFGSAFEAEPEVADEAAEADEAAQVLEAAELAEAADAAGAGEAVQAVPVDDFDIRYEPDSEPEVTEASVSVLPRRSPGSSGIAVPSAEEPALSPEPGTWWSPAESDARATGESVTEAPSNTAGFFSSRRRVRREAGAPAPVEESTGLEESAVEEPVLEEPVVEEPAVEEPILEAPEPEPPFEEHPDDTADTADIDLSDMDRLAQRLSPQQTHSGIDLIYQNMVSEWLDPQEVQQLAVPQDWKSVWDNGWAAAADADKVPIDERTDHGLPVRAPGARLIPGGASLFEAQPTAEDAVDQRSEAYEDEVGSNGGSPERDPDAIRASMSNHFGGVRAARLHSRNTTQGFDDE
ncbi:sensor histidine kinase [Mycolicibacterium confluentis]|uniref:histidine kinase n=1 Tax=Mycolicibacterium confluentis TaxID=28047 RepID=A0A7I7Y061_9MYCO|nr:ATP-binding protein [Mycolicibacterium confluentis]MCV7319975.1 sensor histidine kinase [Mycolicibacterium confluentis]BBZ35008.1 hypothetical protein MCNF_36130 [Mycolicibacterium confluentis]